MVEHATMAEGGWYRCDASNKHGTTALKVSFAGVPQHWSVPSWIPLIPGSSSCAKSPEIPVTQGADHVEKG